MRRFEMTKNGHNKFWEIERRGSEVLVRWGRIGGHGQAQTKHFADHHYAVNFETRMIGAKLLKGYIEVTAGKPGSKSVPRPSYRRVVPGDPEGDFLKRLQAKVKEKPWER